MPQVDPVILELRAQVDKYNSDLAKTTQRVDQLFGRQEQSARKLEKQMLRSSTSMSGSIKALAGTFATYFTGRELVGLLDSFTRLQNNMKVAGLEGDNLKRVQGELLGLSKRYGVSIEALSGVFLKASLSQKELGASTQQIIKLNEIVAASLKITGTSTEEARGALLQLGQALGSGVVRAEEFNSLLENALPIVQAAARGIEGMGGSVSRLRTAIVNGEVTSKQFFDGVLAGGVQTIKDADKATLTLAGGFEALTSSITVYFGEADKANGVSAALGEAMKALADNLDTLIPAIAIVATALGVGMVTNAIAARIAMEGVTAAAVTSGRALLAAFGGPVGLAITAIAAALFYSASASQQNETAMLENAKAAERLGLKLSDAERAAISAANETSGFGSDAKTAEPKIWDFAHAVDGLSQKLWEQAKAARAARIELLKQQESAADQRISEAQANTTEGQARQAQRGGSKIKQGDIIGGVGDIAGAVGRRLNNFFRGGKPAKESAQIISDAQAIRQKIAAEILKAETTPIGKADVPPDTGTGATPAGATGTSGRKGPKDRTAQIEERYANELESLRQRQTNALLSTTQGAEARAALEISSLESAHARAAASVKADKDYSEAQKKRVLIALDQLKEQELAAIEFEKNKQLEQERQELLSAQHDAQRDDLQVQMQLADTQQQRKTLALKMLDLEYEYQKSLLEAVIASNTVTDAKKEEARIALASLNNLNAASKQATSRANETDAERYVRGLNKSPEQINEAIDKIKIDGLEALTDGILEARNGIENLGKAFTRIADQIIADLLRIAIQKAIIGPIANAVFGGIGAALGGGGSGLTSFGGFDSSSLGGAGLVGGRASGGFTRPGGVYRVNEQSSPGRVEGFMSRDGGKIIPLGQMNQLTQGGGRSDSVAVVRLQLTDDLDARIQSVSGSVAVEVVRGSAPGMIDTAARETMSRLRRPSL